jgi:hypothetical protein
LPHQTIKYLRNHIANDAHQQNGLAPIMIGKTAPDRREDELHDGVDRHQETHILAAAAKVFHIERQDGDDNAKPKHDNHERKEKHGEVFVLEHAADYTIGRHR